MILGAKFYNWNPLFINYQLPKLRFILWLMDKEQQVKISPEERKRLDRQRFIGLETQRK